MEKQAVKLYLGKGTTLEILFSNGVTKSYDVLKLASKYPQLNELKNRKLFLNGRLFGSSVVIWNDELDLDSEVVYEDGETIENKDDAVEAILGYQIKQARLKKQMTQAQLSEMIDIDQADLSKIENGRLCPSLSTVKRIAKGLDVVINISII